MTNDKLKIGILKSASRGANASIRHLSFVICHSILFLLLATTTSIASPTDSVRDSFRHFIMPTGKPIEGGYLGFWELAFLQAGYGVGDVFSISAGFTIMPTVAFRSQIGFVQGKLTFFDDQGFSLAGGLNFLRLTSDNTFLHLFGVLTYETPSASRFSGMLFYKMTSWTPEGPDNPLILVNVFPYGSFSFIYNSGLGGGLGFDTPLPGNPNVRFVAEIWNHDLSSPNKLGIIGALRVESDRFSSDFGFMYFTLPLIAPVANFVWRF
ncbi:MAG: hypothetical protein Q8922_00885 [Bacteroidota bacterium]|nr:hypothetical protein [Bacteroidota bacterium]MDP4232588.1 hypothetical protein [Bacteroidota bacterium]MDP4242958.1 hypothetical protein [Bacteroidota bacterium]MDP4286467.1 hypothetical protein [Bacteroidota bacterium]